MEIIEIETQSYEYPIADAWDKKPEWYREWHNAMTGWEKSVEARQECVIKIRTDEGLTGIGSADTSHRHPEIVTSVIDKVLKPSLIGEDPTNVERLWHKMKKACGPRLAGANGIGYGAIGGLNVACWDILGKKMDAPVYEVLGGDNGIRVTPYIGTFTHGWRRPDDIGSVVDEAQFYKDKGFNAIKIRGGRSDSSGVDADISTMETLRDVFDPRELDIMLDVNSGYNKQLAYRMIDEFEEHDLFWVEDPFPTTDLKEYAEFQEETHVDVFIGGGPSSEKLSQMINSGSTTNLVSVSTEHGGGISEALKVSTIINKWNLKTAGISHEPLGSLPLFHVWKSIPQEITEGSYVEYDPINSCWDELLTDPPEFKDGELVLSDKPGLGTDVDDKFLSKYEIRGDSSLNAL